MKTLADHLHCPRCKGRLNTITAESIAGTPAGSLFCTMCEAIVPAPDGIPDFFGDRTVGDTHPLNLSGNAYGGDDDAAALQERIRGVAGPRWPASLGDVLELGCGGGRMTRTLVHNDTVPIAARGRFRAWICCGPAATGSHRITALIRCL